MPTTVIDGQDRSRDTAGRKRDSRRTYDTPIDWTHLSRFTLNDKALEHEVLGLFAMDAPRYLAKMVGARGRKDWIEAAHTLKGSARAVGAWNVAEYAEVGRGNAAHGKVRARGVGGQSRHGRSPRQARSRRSLDRCLYRAAYGHGAHVLGTVRNQTVENQLAIIDCLTSIVQL